jgi:alpha-tubulin suppressor-like RCC1 family protein
MITSRSISRATLRAPHGPKLSRNISSRRPAQTRAAIHPYAQRRQQHFVRSIAIVTALGATGTAYQFYQGERISRNVHAEEPPTEQELAFEKPRRAAASKEENRDLISSQHLQVKRSWENPGVYVWGSNSGKVVAPDSDEKYVKSPRRLSFFDGQVLRHLKLDRNFAAAIDEKGDLLQWGTAFSKDVKEPTRTLRGMDLIQCAISRDRIIALSSSGAVYSVPVSQEEQQNGPKPTTTSWIPFWGSSSNISYRIRTPENLSWNERVTDVASGLEHALLRTSAGRVYSLASGSENYPSRGQLGIPGLTWESRPEGAFDLPHEITTLKGFPIAKIAAGDYHSLVSDTAGRAFGFGDNSSGQLGFEFNSEALHIDAPSLLPTQRFYGTGQQATVTNVFAGGNTSFLSIESTTAKTAARDTPRVTADTWAFGHGLTGQLGTGRWIHNQSAPIKVPAFSGLFEYDEDASRVIPIKLAYISVGATHAAAVMDNVANISVSSKTISKKQTENDTNWGRDILFWGNNEFYQIGTGKRSNISTPTYIQPLDQQAEVERTGGRKADKEWHRFQITPRHRVKVGGRTVEMEQRVECGRAVSAVYSAV